MIFLNTDDVLQLHSKLISESGGSHGLRDEGALDSAVAQPRMTFGGEELYPGLTDKAAALGYSLISNHPFIDGNKRIGHQAMETFLVVNGHELAADVDEQERVILAVASGQMEREAFGEWVSNHICARS